LHPSLTKKLSAIVFDIQFWLSDRISWIFNFSVSIIPIILNSLLIW
jgi:hypothetical protein